jgi:serine/threonine protein kinase
VLLDFGSARQALSEDLAKFSPSYTPGFASPEQYYDRKLLGPWSDIYSIGATMYSCLTRTSPPAANQRIKNDLLIPAIKIGKDNYSQDLLEIIDKCMSLDYLERPQSVFSLQKSLLESKPDPKKEASFVNKIVGALNTPITMEVLNKPITMKKSPPKKTAGKHVSTK